MKYWASLINTLSIVALGLAALAAVTGTVILPGGYRLYSVLTGSMEPTFAPGALVAVRRIPDVGAVAVGDVISFQQPGQPNRIVTHRVHGVEAAGSATFFQTKGDANPSADPWRVSYGHLVGTVVWSVPVVGGLLTALHSPWAVALLVWLPVLLLAFHELYTIHTILAELQLEKRKALA